MKWDDEKANPLEDIKLALKNISNNTGLVPPTPEMIAEDMMKALEILLSKRKCSKCGNMLQWIVMESCPDVRILNCFCNIPMCLWGLFQPEDLHEFFTEMNQKTYS